VTNVSELAIRVSGLGKQYRLGPGGPRARYRTLRDELREAVTRPFRRREPGVSFWALRDVSLEVARGEVVGIIGRNGAGKSTLLKILSRITEPTEGEADLYGRVGSLLEVGTGFHPELTGRENVFLNGAILGMSRAEIARKFAEIVAFAEVEKFIDTPVKFYSSGMYVRLAFAVAAHMETEILVVDEVLAVGDAGFQERVLGKMGDIARGGRTVLFVSHNMPAVRGLCSRAILLAAGRVVRTGQTAEVVADYLGLGPDRGREFTTGPLRSIEVRQDGTEIVISAEFAVGRSLGMVNFGFVVSDEQARPVLGTNPKFDGLSEFGRGAAAGRVIVRVREPKLRDGRYLLSVWLGDGHEDFFSEPHCVAFEVAQMTGRQAVAAATVGPVVPVCTWAFEEDTA
jgi:lipopolysaccharide transport system ATP-binding protein